MTEVRIIEERTTEIQIANMNSFQFPIITFSSSTIYIARSEHEILICYKTALSNNFYKGMKIIDSAGTLFNIIDAKKIRGHGLFRGYNIFFNQKIEVELMVKSQKSIDIDNFKNLIFVNVDESFWNSGENYNIIIDKINSLSTINSIIHYLAIIFYNE